MFYISPVKKEGKKIRFIYLLPYYVGAYSINLLLLHCISKITTNFIQTSGKNFSPNS